MSSRRGGSETRPKNNHNNRGGLRPAPTIAFSVVALLIAFLSFRGASQTQPDAFDGYNVLLVTIDTLRADHLPVYGYKQVRTPNIDRLARRSLVFTDAVSHAPLTLPSHTAILTGLLPAASGIRDNAGYFLDPSVTTLAEIFRNAGYKTSAFVSAFVLDSTWKLNQGFDVYFDHFTSPSSQERRAEETEREASRWLQQNVSKPFFCWVHLYDPHDPYDPPEPYRTEYAGRPYDGEIAYTDSVLGRLLDQLEAQHLSDRTIVIVTADHGEGLGDHNEAGHSLFIYNSTQHIPLIIRLPGGNNRTIGSLVRHIDLAPTLLEWTGLQAPAEMQGRSLTPLLDGKEEKERAAISESLYAQIHYGWSPLYSLTTSAYRYIDAPRSELYDRKADPEERSNLIGKRPQIAAAMKSQLEEQIRTNTRSNQGPQRIDPEAEEKLRSLGYLSSSGVPPSVNIDPKDKLDVHRNYMDALAALEAKQFTVALQNLDRVLLEFPDMPDAHFAAGAAYAGAGNRDRAIAEYELALQLRPEHPMAAYNLASVYEAAGDWTKAEKYYTKVLQLSPNHRFSLMRLAEVYRRLGQPEKSSRCLNDALAWHRKALESTQGEEARSQLFALMGQLYFEAGDYRMASEHLEAAIVLTPNHPSLHYNLGLAYEFLDRPRDAVIEYERELQTSRPHAEAYLNLSLLYRKMNSIAKADLLLEKYNGTQR